MNAAETQRTEPNITTQLVERYGYLMTPVEVASVLRINSVDALRMARKRGKVPLSPVAGASRNQRFSTVDVAALLSAWIAPTSAS
jgi:hypothetical protein